MKTWFLVAILITTVLVGACAAPAGPAVGALPTSTSWAEVAATEAPVAEKEGGETPAVCASLREKHGSTGKTVRVGMTPTSPGYGTLDPKDSSNALGVDADMVAAISDCLGMNYKYEFLDFGGLITALQGGRIDIIYSGMYATPARAEQVNFIVYQKAFTGSVVQKGTAAKFASINDVCGAKASTVTGTVEAEQLLQFSDKCVADGKGAIEILTFKDNDAAARAVQTKRADIFMSDAGMCGGLQRQFPDALDLGFSIASDFRFGVGLRKDDKVMTDALLDTMKALQEEGLHSKFLESWGFGAAASIPVELVTN